MSISQAHISGGNGLNLALGLQHRRRLYDAEIAELSILIPLLESIVLFPNQEDQLIWLGDKKGIFSVKAAYLNYSQGDTPVIPFPSSKKMCLYMLPTLTNLHHRHTALDSPNRVWNYFINVVGGTSVVLSSVKEVIVGWKSYPLNAQGNQLWKRLPAEIPWGLWKARNAIAFSGKTFKLHEVIRDIKIDAFNWSKSLDCFKGISTSSVIVGWEQFFINPH
ncbi:hypothetical protein MKW98_019131 [Papaver atlanticum]|uniref:Uncharacterized protein n=1 Tax=Papaver atlanticum TaxID=357466 RepID=A0AAD4TL48_9MAGN|nr:hypothetical protein MKW98_019131 [Papaver atlanticum]